MHRIFSWLSFQNIDCLVHTDSIESDINVNYNSYNVFHDYWITLIIYDTCVDKGLILLKKIFDSMESCFYLHNFSNPLARYRIKFWEGRRIFSGIFFE